MADWIHCLANDWGHWMRRSAAIDSAIQGTLGRIRDEGLDGAAIRAHSDKIPITEFPLDVARFHRAWKQLEPHLNAIIFLDYRMRDPLQRKLRVARVSKSKYYRLRRQALDAIARNMALAV